MKKALIVLLLGVALSALAFSVENYVVQSVSGMAEREVAPGVWEPITAGMTLSEITVVRTGLNSSMILRKGETMTVVRAMQKSTVEGLSKTPVSGIRLGGKIAESTTAASTRGTGNVSTASTRASDATQDLEWTE